MHPTSIFDLVLRDHERRLAESSAARGRARTASRSDDVRDVRSLAARTTGRPPDPALLYTTLLRSTLGVTAR